MKTTKGLQKFFIYLILAALIIGIVSLVVTLYTLPQSHSDKKLTKNSANQSSPLAQIKHVFVIIEENHDWSQIKNNPEAPFLNQTLLAKGASAEQYYNLPKQQNALHPSEPNYIIMEGGKITYPDHTFTTNAPPTEENSTDTPNHFVKLLEKKGLTWKSYQEDISGTNCPIESVNQYAPKHNPYVFFKDNSGNLPDQNNQYCIDHNRPFTELQTDLEKKTVPNYVFITPNLQNDMHEGSIGQADRWLSQVVPMIMKSKTFQDDGALFITWDEGQVIGTENRPIGMIVLSTFVKPGYSNSIEYSHYSYLKTIQEIFNLNPLLGGASDPKTSDLSDFFRKI